MWRSSEMKLVVISNCVMFCIILAPMFSHTANLCNYLTFPYVVFSFLFPVFNVLLFRAIPGLKPFSTSLFGMYLAAFDVFSDFFTIYYLFEDGAWIFAVLHIVFIIMGQVAGAVFHAFRKDGNKEHHAMTNQDKVMALFGFSEIWFVIKWWEETFEEDEESPDGKYTKLKEEHKIWSLMYVPSILSKL